MKSLFSIKKGNDDKRFPFSVAFQGIGVSKFQTMDEATERLRTARIGEKKWFKKNIN